MVTQNSKNMNNQLFHEEIAHVKLQPEIGVLSKGYAALPLDLSVEEGEEMYGYLEQFLYFDVGMESQIYLLADPYKLTDAEEFILYAPGIVNDEFEFIS